MRTVHLTNITMPTAPWIQNLAGRFIVFDGPDGSGKSSQFSRLADLVSTSPVRLCKVREPGGTPLGEQIREILLDNQNASMDVRCEMLLYMASRAQLVHDRIAPALGRREFVLADRFVSSTYVYQGYAGGLARADIRAVSEIVCHELRERTGRNLPDLVVIFDVDEKTAASRLSPLLDRMEAKGAEFHRKVRQGYLALASSDPDHHAVIDASRSPEDVFEDLVSLLAARFPAPLA